MNEGSLHEALKKLYAGKGDATESIVDGYIVDIVNKDAIIEIQTGGFSNIKNKLTSLLPRHRIRLVYPVAVERTITVMDSETEKMLYRRKSPKKGELIDIAGEILYIPKQILHPNFSLEVLLTKEEEIRAADGKGSWRRKGMSIVDRKLLEIMDRVEFIRLDDYMRLLPHKLPPLFTNRIASRIMGRPTYKIARLTYSLRQLGLLEITGKQGGAHVFQIVTRRALNKNRAPLSNPRNCPV